MISLFYINYQNISLCKFQHPGFFIKSPNAEFTFCFFTLKIVLQLLTFPGHPPTIIIVPLLVIPHQFCVIALHVVVHVLSTIHSSFIARLELMENSCAVCILSDVTASLLLFVASLTYSVQLAHRSSRASH